MTQETRKLSEVMKEMAQRCLKDPHATPSSEAAHVALMFAGIAWNETVGLVHAREGYRSAWETIEAQNPALWNEFKSNDVDAMLDELAAYKKQHFPGDGRRILICGILDGNVRVEWLPAAAPGVDSKAEMRLYGLVSTGDRESAIQFLKDAKHLSPQEAANEVDQISQELGLR